MSIIFVIAILYRHFLQEMEGVKLRKQKILTLTYLVKYVYLISFVKFGIGILGKEGKQKKSHLFTTSLYIKMKCRNS